MNNHGNGKFWKSLKQFGQDNTASKQTEFVEGATADFDPSRLPEVSRRKFMSILGATTALTAVGCSDYRDKGEIISYNKQPEEVIYGRPNFYASTGPDGHGILIKAREGRPIKIEGNPEHKITKGKIGIRDHASILDLYDPSRLKNPKIRAGNILSNIDWNEADNNIRKELIAAKNSGKEIAIISKGIYSPSTKKVLDNFTAKYPTAKLYSYELFNDIERKAAWKACFGNENLPVIHWDKPDVIISLNADFLATEGEVEVQSREFTSRRDKDNPKNFNKLYQIEGEMSATGSLADYRLRMNPIAQFELAMALLKEAVLKTGKIDIIPDSIKTNFGKYDLETVVKKHHLDKEKVNELKYDLIHHYNHTLVYAGDVLPKQTHVVVNLLNYVLNENKFYSKNHYKSIEIPLSTNEEIADLVKDMNSGKIHVAIVLDSNPVYHMPNELKFEEAFKKAACKVVISTWENETSEYADYILPANHYIESWGDYKKVNGGISSRQPVISPLYDTREAEAILLNWANDSNNYKFDDYHKFIMANWEESFPTIPGFKELWYSALHDGYVEYSEPYEMPSEINFEMAANIIANNLPEPNGYSVIFTKNPNIGDGSHANNGWLQEIPHTVTKVVWDNCAVISPKTAKKLDVAYGKDKEDKKTNFINLSLNGNTVKLPIMVQAGMADDLIAVDLGYGRTKAGDVGNNVGFDVMGIANSNNITSRLYTGAKVEKADGTYDLVTTQEHHDLDDTFVKDIHKKRYLVEEATVDDYIADPHVIHPHKPEESIYPGHKYEDVKWAMAIDMNKCTGCNQCTASCNVENNIQVVGKDQVAVGREMHWIRLDLYYSGTPDDPHASLQPMLCQHCDNAPCENVCPVVATTHSPDGINQMVYNRCVGTRYCANNCPYKVRRFNFYDFDHRFQDGYYESDSVELMRNPEVTVRSRGVMEKCTFCSQRIMEGRQEAIKAGEEFDGRHVKTACQEACPTDAIVFGNVNDPNSEVSKLRKHNLGYHVLEMMNVAPNVTYIAKLWNKKSKEGAHNGHH